MLFKIKIVYAKTINVKMYISIHAKKSLHKKNW